MRELRIWWISNPPREMFTQEVKDKKEAKKLLDLLANYDLYLGDEMISANVGGLEVTETGDWDGSEWYDEEGNDIWAEED